ncbi:MAG: branched-chain amino acid ABC transporter substrate-binding protein [Symbiobacterium thermophilum]|uniref:Branched-chain amino acid ABC transporter substrate-binding protein n=1 Tax=Symbiobacterium thermophilum TaxID=2734 RepID=A0A953IA82_SYMTR|nr:branched-chain amino acid ABC transporter substrate-binding protein [Symbiobacterium thermophilum]
MKIGWIGPLSGANKTYGESAKRGVELALEEAGYKVGDLTVELIAGDDRSDSTEAVNLATKMMTQDRVAAIIDPVTSGSAIAVSAIAETYKVPMITATATAPKVTVNDDGKRKPFVFRACFIDPFQGQAAANFASRELGLKRAAVFYDKGNDYTIGLAEAFRETFEANGGEVVAWQSYSSEDTDFSAIMTNVAALKPDVLYLPDYYGRVSLIAKAAKDKGINVPMLGGDGWDSPDLDSATLAGGYFTAHYSEQDQREAVQQFATRFQERYGERPDSFAALGYDAAKLLLGAIERAGSTDGEALRAALQSTQDFPAVGGQLSFDEWGNPIKSAALLQVQADGSYKYITNVD